MSPVAAPDPTAAPAAPAAAVAPPDSPRRRRAAVAIILLLLLQGAAFLPSPAWHLDLRNEALHGFPRLLGVWSPLALLLLFFVGAPITMITWELFAPTPLRPRVRSWWLAWFVAALMLVGVEGLLRARPHLVPYHAIPYLPYGGGLEYPAGVHFFQDDPLLMMRHRSNISYRVALNGYTMEGSLYGGREGSPATFQAGGEDHVTWRHSDEFGFDADFGSLHDADHPATIAALGDSFTVGYLLPPEMTWPGVLAQRLAATGHAPPADPADPLSSVATFACGNFTPHEGLMGMRLTTPPRLPDVIIALYYESNDISDAETNARRRAVGLSPAGELRRGVLRSPEPWITQVRLHALLAALVAPTDLRVPPQWRRIPWLRFQARPRAEVARIRADPALADLGSQPEGTLSWMETLLPPFLVEVGGRTVETTLDAREFIFAASPGEWPPSHTGWRHVRAGLEDLAALREQAGVRVIVALAPSKVRTYLPFIADEELSAERLDPIPRARGELYLAYHLRERKKSWAELLRANEATISRHLERECGQLRLEFIDLAGPLRDAIRDEERLPYLPWDTHWNSLGQRVAGEVIADYLARTSEPGSTRAVANIDDFMPPVPGPLVIEELEEEGEAGDATTVEEGQAEADTTEEQGTDEPGPGGQNADGASVSDLPAPPAADDAATSPPLTGD